MRFLLLSVLASLCLAPQGFAGLLEVSPGTREIEGVKVSVEAKATVAGRSHSLKLAGAGLRYKKVAFFKADVYVAELLMSTPEKLVRTAEGALDSLAQQEAVAIRMTFLRDVEAKKISGGFEDGLKENKVPLDSPHVKMFLEAVRSAGESKKGTTLVVLGEKLAGGKEAVSWENSSGKVVSFSGDTGLIKTIFSIWLGKIDDSGLESLRKEMLGIKN